MNECIETINHSSNRYSTQNAKRFRILGEHYCKMFKEDQLRLDSPHHRQIPSSLYQF